MKRSAKCKCVHCSELFLSDFRIRGRQRYCAKPECRKVARRSSQQRWLAKVENQNYFRGPENCARVREWRARHPGYWRKKKPAPRDALQESCCAQVPPDKETATPAPPDALQELCVMQPAVLVGLISTILRSRKKTSRSATSKKSSSSAHGGARRQEEDGLGVPRRRS